MGVGPSNLALMQADSDLRELEWEAIEQDLEFFRKWDMDDVTEAICRFKGLKHIMESDKESLDEERAQELLKERTEWKLFYEVVHEIEQKRLRKLESRERMVWHPACGGYAMLYDHSAKEKYDDWMLGDTIRPGGASHGIGELRQVDQRPSGPEPYELEYHTDDDESVPEEEPINEGDMHVEEMNDAAETSEQDQNPQDGGDDAEVVDPSEPIADDDAEPIESDTPPVQGGAPAGPVNDDDVTGDITGDAIDKKGSRSGDRQASEEDGRPEDYQEEDPSSKFIFANGQYQLREKFEHELRVSKRARPPEFDPNQYSPIFFGYSPVTVQQLLDEEDEERLQQERSEDRIVQEQLKEQQEMLEGMKSDHRGRREKRDAKVKTLLSKHDKEKRARLHELGTAKQMMDKAEFELFEAQWRKDEIAVERANKLEQQELTVHNKVIFNQEELKATALEASTRSAVAAQTNDRPNGEKLERDARVALNECVVALDTACKQLDDAQQQLKITREEILEDGGTDPNARSLLIRVEAEVEKGERAVESSLQRIADTEVVLNRAVKRRGKERVLLPLYQPLASDLQSDDFTAPSMHLLAAMVIACSDSIEQKLRVLTQSFDLDADKFLNIHELRDLLFALVSVLRAIRYFKTTITLEEVESVVLRAMHEMGVEYRFRSGGLTIFEAKKWTTSLIAKSPYLATLFNCPYEYGELSVYQRQQIGIVRQFEMGLINLADLKYHAAFMSIQYRPQLSPDNKLVIHERALAMGGDDPLKPDYSKFLPKKKKKTLTNVIPLEHGHLGNLSVYRHTVLSKCALKLQNYYRGMQARRAAQFQARKQAFLQAEKTALEEGRKAVEAEFEANEALEGTAKLKWDAKIRIRLTKLKAQGQMVDRAAVVNMYLEEAIEQRLEAIKKRFHELAIEKGFESAEKEDHSRKFDVPDVDPEDDPRFDKPDSQAEKAKKAAMRLLFGSQEAYVDEDIVTPRGGDELEDPQLDKAKKALSVEPALTTRRRELMVRGEAPPELYQTGLTDEEERLRAQLMLPEPSPQQLFERLRLLDSSFTQLKTEELMLELPSKNLLMKYVNQFSRLDELASDLKNHFQLIRHSETVAQIFKQLLETDLERGLMLRAMEYLRQSQDRVISRIASSEAEAGIARAQALAEKRARSAKTVSVEEKLQQQREKDEKDFQKRLATKGELEASVEKVARKLRTIHRVVSELKRRQVNMQRYELRAKGESVDIAVEPELRCDWVKRFHHVKGNIPEGVEQARDVYREIKSVGRDFLAAAERCARIIVDEYYLPHEQKTIQPIAERQVDGRYQEGDRGIDGRRYKYEACNIRFKVWLDDHGICNGSDEYAAKSAGNDLRASLEYFKCHLDEFTIPFEACVDYHGFRVLCVAKLPIEHTVFSEAGDLRKSFEEMVHGTANRGETVVTSSKILDNRLAEAARSLNIAKHGVKGQKDILTKFINCSVDIRVFKDTANTFSLLNFWRAMPPEHPESTEHLSLAPRGHSIFWRQLRPELVRHNHLSQELRSSLLAELRGAFEANQVTEEMVLADDNGVSPRSQQTFQYLPHDVKKDLLETLTLPDTVKIPLSPDANCMVTNETPDWEGHMNAVRDATVRLVNEVIPEFAESLSQRNLNGSPAQGFGLDITTLLHRNGINVRHMGLLRSLFWRRLHGHVNVQFNSAVLATSVDMRPELPPGSTVALRGRKYTVSDDASQHTAKQLTLSEKITDLSVNRVELFTGTLSSERNSQELRLILLAEMSARAIKNIARHYLRSAAKAMKVVVGNLHRFVVVEFLNMTTGAHDDSERFWRGQVYHAIRQRFGVCAVSAAEHANIRADLEPTLVFIVNRLVCMLGIQISRRAFAFFNDEPLAFRFTMDDVECSGVRVKHNISVLEFAEAQLLTMQAKQRREDTYERIVIADSPLVYLKLAERRGARMAYNAGLAGMHMCGFYSRACKMESVGPIANDELNRAVLFEPLLQPRIDLKFNEALAPLEEEAPWSLEVWCKAVGSMNTSRTVLMSGRYMITANRDNRWQFDVFSGLNELSVLGSEVKEDEWVYLVCTYDGTMARLWIDSRLYTSVEVGPRIHAQRAEKLEEYETQKKQLKVLEEKAREAVKKVTDEQAAAFFRSKDGQDRMKQAAMKMMEQAEFKLKMDARAAEKGIKKLTKHEARAQARSEYKTALYMKNVQEVAAQHNRRMEEFLDTVKKDEEEAHERSTKAIRIGATCASKRAKEGRHFFHGEICHVAVYPFELQHDVIRKHYFSAIQERSTQADRLFTLAAVKYQGALSFAPDDRMILDKYAESLCDNLVFEGTSPEAERWNRRKVEEAIDIFQRSENCDALSEILRRLPSGHQHADLACRAFAAVMEVNAEYYTLKSHVTLKEIAHMPQKFALANLSASEDCIETAAGMYRLVLSEPVLSSIYGEDDDLSWASGLRSNRVLCGLVELSHSDSDSRLFDLSEYLAISDLSDEDLTLVADHRRLTLAFNLKDCSKLTDDGLHMAARFCTSLQALTIDKCDKLTDKSMGALKKFCPSLSLLSMQRCHRITDLGLVQLVHTTKKLRIINLNYCRMVSDESLLSIAEHCQWLELLHASFCTGVTDAGLYSFAMRVNRDTFTSLDVSYNRGIGDDAVEAIASRCNQLTYLNLCGVNRVTDHSAKVVTHNLWKLTSLNLEDLYLITDDIFHFDHKRDGRKAAEAQMMTSLTELNVSECTSLTNTALGGIATRCEKLQHFFCSGIANVTDAGIDVFLTEPVAKARRGAHLSVLDLSCVDALTDEAIGQIARACINLEVVNLNGCIRITDEGVGALCRDATHIKVLGVAFCKRLTDRAVCTMADHLWLEEIDLTSCSHVTDDAIEVLCLEFAGMRKLDLSKCANVTDASIDSLARHSHHLKWLKLCDMPQVSKLAVEMLRERFPAMQLITENSIDEERGKAYHSIF